MNKLVLGVAISVLVSSSALAADMRYPAPRGPAPVYAAPPPPPPPAFSWTGFYIGAQGGYGWGETDESFLRDPNRANFLGSQSYDINGGLAGGVIGYNWAMAGFIIGIEGEGNWANIKGSSGVISTGVNDFYDTEIRGLTTVKGRLGMGFDRTMLYVTGGGAWASVRSRYNPANSGNCFNTVCESRDTHSGWVVGAGGEWAFTPNVSFKIEYNYVSLDTSDLRYTSANLNRSEFDNDFSVIKAGVNFRFGGAGPLYARY